MSTGQGVLASTTVRRPDLAEVGLAQAGPDSRSAFQRTPSQVQCRIDIVVNGQPLLVAQDDRPFAGVTAKVKDVKNGDLHLELAVGGAAP